MACDSHPTWFVVAENSAYLPCRLPRGHHVLGSDGSATSLTPTPVQCSRPSPPGISMTVRRFTIFVLTFSFLFSALLASQTQKDNVDLLVTGGTVVTMDGTRAIYDDGAVVVKGDAIVAVGPRSNLETRYAAAQTINAKGKLVLPGFINGHTHVPMTLFRGLHDDVTLNDWLY